MSKGSFVKEVRFTATKRGRRAFYWSSRGLRWFPLPLAEAELLVATGAAKDITADHAKLGI